LESCLPFKFLSSVYDVLLVACKTVARRLFSVIPIREDRPKKDENSLGEANIEATDTKLERINALSSLTLDYSQSNGVILNSLP